jgi:UDP-2,3-diacylglucosamine pyrophosphatase LpxH
LASEEVGVNPPIVSSFRARTVSDVHPGSRGCHAAAVLDFPRRRDFGHVAADGRRCLVVPGDDCDGAVRFSGAPRTSGAWMYDVMLHLAGAVGAARRRLGLPHWSLATWVKQRVAGAFAYVARFEHVRFEHATTHDALRRGLGGVICGHVHRPGVRTVDGILRCNGGDRVQHCTAHVEDRSERMPLRMRGMEPAA